MRVADAGGGGFFVEVEPGEIAGVGLVLEPHVHRVGTVVDRGFQGGQAAGGADQFGQGRHILRPPLEYRKAVGRPT